MKTLNTYTIKDTDITILHMPKRAKIKKAYYIEDRHEIRLYVEIIHEENPPYKARKFKVIKTNTPIDDSKADYKLIDIIHSSYNQYTIKGIEDYGIYEVLE